jgi:hypothetical protein
VRVGWEGRAPSPGGGGESGLGALAPGQMLTATLGTAGGKGALLSVTM